MPPLPFVPGVIRFAVEGTVGSGTWVNVIHARYTGTVPDHATLDSFANSLLTGWNTAFSPLMPVSSTLEAVRCVDLSTDIGAAGNSESSLPGARTGTLLPASTCVVLAKGSARRYRGGHPRTYLCVGVESDLADTSHWAAGLLSAATGAYVAATGFLGSTTVAGTVLGFECAVSYIDKALNPVPPYRRAVPLIDDLGGFVARARIGTQRNRLAG
jgi:hypothetical protein